MNAKKVTNLVFRAVGLAMGVAVVVLSRLGQVDPNSCISMLGIGLACLGVASLSENI